MTTLNRQVNAFGRLVAKAEDALVSGAGDALLLGGIAIASVMGLASLLT
jgi:hypothetical protein